MTILFIINDAPYGTEKAYNALRLANQILKDSPDTIVKVFLLADAVACGIGEQKTPEGYYNIGRMIKAFVSRGGEVKMCGTCMDARGITEQMLQDGVQRSNMVEFSQWTINAEKVITF
jgi:uncharacterized protein involved in oxidation of intracellular sulfur